MPISSANKRHDAPNIRSTSKLAPNQPKSRPSDTRRTVKGVKAVCTPEQLMPSNKSQQLHQPKASIAPNKIKPQPYATDNQMHSGAPNAIQARPKQQSTFFKLSTQPISDSSIDVEDSNSSNNSNSQQQDLNTKSTISLDGRKLVLASTSTINHPASVESISCHPDSSHSSANFRVPQQKILPSKTSGYLLSNQQYNKHLQMSQSTFNLPSTTTSSTAQLHSMSPRNQGSSMTFRRNVNLKYIKTVIIFLLAIDLVITVFVHQFAVQDHISIWFTSFKPRFSMLNLMLSAIWFIILTGAILFDVYSILVVACIVDIASFVTLLGFSINHFMRRIDYNTVNMASLLGLLFSIIVLHVYLILTSSLMVYLMLAVRRRKTSHSNLG